MGSRLRRGGVRRGVAAAVFVVLCAAGVASAGTGDLTAKGCISDKTVGDVDCADRTKGLDGPVGLAISPDGDSVYVVSRDDSDVVRFDRNSAGKLKPKGCIEDKQVSSSACASHTQGLTSPFGVDVSSDGKSVYTASRDDDAVAWFKRKSSGKLKAKGCIDVAQPGATCHKNTVGIRGATDVAVSDDGRSVYVAAGESNAVTLLKRNRKTGALSAKQCIIDEPGGEHCSPDVPGLGGATEVEVSPDDRSVYVASSEDDAVAAFKRKPKGTLKPLGCVDDNDTGTDTCAADFNGLNGVRGLALSPDGTSLYAVSGSDDAIVRFSRDTATGEIEAQGCTQDNDTAPDGCGGSADGLENATDVAVSDDGLTVYVAGQFDDALVRFQRDTATGALSGDECIDDPDTAGDTCADSADGLRGVVGVVISPHDDSLYTAAFADNAVARFDKEH